MTASDRLVMRRPDDWHLHLRDGAMLRAVLPATARTFARAVVMPNLRPPVTSVDEAIAYRARILEALPEGLRFEPLMTAYLTDAIDPWELDRGFRQGVFSAAKLYPANATTNSAAGVSDFSKISGVLERMEAIDMPLLEIEPVPVIRREQLRTHPTNVAARPYIRHPLALVNDTLGYS